MNNENDHIESALDSSMQMMNILNGWNSRLDRMEEVTLRPLSKNMRHLSFVSSSNHIERTMALIHTIADAMDVTGQELDGLVKEPNLSEWGKYISSLRKVKNSLDTLSSLNLPSCEMALQNLDHLYKQGFNVMQTKWLSMAKELCKTQDVSLIVEAIEQSNNEIPMASVEKSSLFLQLFQGLKYVGSAKVSEDLCKAYLDMRTVFINSSLESLKKLLLYNRSKYRPSSNPTPTNTSSRFSITITTAIHSFLLFLKCSILLFKMEIWNTTHWFLKEDWALLMEYTSRIFSGGINETCQSFLDKGIKNFLVYSKESMNGTHSSSQSRSNLSSLSAVSNNDEKNDTSSIEGTYIIILLDLYKELCQIFAPSELSRSLILGNNVSDPNFNAQYLSTLTTLPSLVLISCNLAFGDFLSELKVLISRASSMPMLNQSASSLSSIVVEMATFMSKLVLHADIIKGQKFIIPKDDDYIYSKLLKDQNEIDYSPFIQFMSNLIHQMIIYIRMHSKIFKKPEFSHLYLIVNETFWAKILDNSFSNVKIPMLMKLLDLYYQRLQKSIAKEKSLYLYHWISLTDYFNDMLPDKGNTKERLKEFTADFENQLILHKDLTLQDSELKSALISQIKNGLTLAYRAFLSRNQAVLVINPKWVKMDIDQLIICVDKLFSPP